jgi:hypothetical protein
MTAINKQHARHEIEELLPWYATGTLSGREAERVEQALAGDRELRTRYDLIRRELAETTRLNEALGAPSALGPEVVIGIRPVNVIEQVIMGVGPEQRSEPAKDKTATPPRPGRTGESAVEPRMPELRLQRHVGNGAVAEHPVTQVAPAGEKMLAAAVSGKACAVSAATMPAASVFATMPTASVFAALRVCFECEKRHDEEQHRGHASAGCQHRPHSVAGLRV